MDFLSEVASRKREILSTVKKRVPETKLKALARSTPPPRSLLKAIREILRKGIRPIVAEYKRGSPSRGVISLEYDPVSRIGAYLDGGAVAISILTEPNYFLGSLEDLLLIRRRFPKAFLLRKDFVVDPYQIWESRLYGANAVLLIVDLIGKELDRFLRVCQEAGVEALVEIYREEELSLALRSRAELIGINARNLRDLSTSYGHVVELLRAIPEGRIAVAESGIKNLEDLLSLEKAGAQAFLIGESLMQHPDPRGLLKNWIYARDPERILPEIPEGLEERS
jgi:indole-3-glycerol phosphate synthase